MRAACSRCSSRSPKRRRRRSSAARCLRSLSCRRVAGNRPRTGKGRGRSCTLIRSDRVARLVERVAQITTAAHRLRSRGELGHRRFGPARPCPRASSIRSLTGGPLGGGPQHRAAPPCADQADAGGASGMVAPAGRARAAAPASDLRGEQSGALEAAEAACELLPWLSLAGARRRTRRSAAGRRRRRPRRSRRRAAGPRPGRGDCRAGS